MSAHADRLNEVSTDTEFVDVETSEVVYQGEPLTDSKVEAIVARVRRANLKPGGKAMNADGTHSKPLSVRLPDDLRAKVESMAAKRGVSSSKFVREVLTAYVKEHPANGESRRVG